MKDNEFESKRGYLLNSFEFFHIKDKKYLEFEFHHHDFNKIIIFKSGKVTYLIEGKAYKLRPWDILLISNSDIHRPIIDAGVVYDRIVLWISPEFTTQNSDESCSLSSCFEIASSNKCSLIRLASANVSELEFLASNIEKSIVSSEMGKRILQTSLLLQLLIFTNRITAKDTDVNIRQDVICDKKIEAILDYINSNLGKDLLIDDIASRFFLNKYYLMHLFKEQTGYSIHSYIVQKRLILARSLIKNGYSLSCASVECGFEDYSSFVKAFKKHYGVSPKNYISK